MLNVSVLLTEGEIAASLRAEIEARRIPEKFFYWSPESAAAWLDLCRSEAYLNYRRSLDLMTRESAALLEALPRRPAEVVSLGCGDGSKEIPILDALARSGPPVLYVAVDVSQWLLEVALARMAREGRPARGVKADLTSAGHLAAVFGGAGGPPRLYTLLGNTVGALDHAAFLGGASALMGPGDRLLVDAEIYRPEATLGGYLNPDNRRFATGPLRSLGITDADGEVVFELVEEEDPPGLRRLRKRFRAGRDLDVRAGAASVRIARGETLDMGYSCKYTREAFAEVLRRFGRFEVDGEAISGDGGFILVLARAAAPARG